MTTEVKPLTAKDVAAKLKIEPHYLRAMLRKITGKAEGKRYEWKPNDPFLQKLPALIKAEEEKAAAAKKKAAAADKKAAKPASDKK